MLTKKYPSTTRIVGIVLRSYIPNSGGANPRYPLMSEMKEMYLKAYYEG